MEPQSIENKPIIDPYVQNVSSAKTGFSFKEILLVIFITFSLLMFLILITLAIYFLSPYRDSLAKQINIEKITRLVYLPLNPQSRTVDGVSIVYTINGNILDLKKSDLGTEIITDIKINGLPDIIATSRTQFYNENTHEKTTIQDLEKGQKVSIDLGYGLTKREWRVIRVEIL